MSRPLRIVVPGLGPVTYVPGERVPPAHRRFVPAEPLAEPEPPAMPPAEPEPLAMPLAEHVPLAAPAAAEPVERLRKRR